MRVDLRVVLAPSPAHAHPLLDVDLDLRAVVHAECKKIGLKSKSHGKGAERRVHVTKADAYVPEDAEDLFDLGVGRRATAAMEQYFGAAIT